MHNILINWYIKIYHAILPIKVMLYLHGLVTYHTNVLKTEIIIWIIQKMNYNELLYRGGHYDNIIDEMNLNKVKWH
jgi:hypothetical protein